MVADYCGTGLIGPDCSIAHSVDPSWLSAECYPSRAYDPLPLPPNIEDSICVKAERTFTPEPSRPTAYEGKFRPAFLSSMLENLRILKTLPVAKSVFREVLRYLTETL